MYMTCMSVDKYVSMCVIITYIIWYAVFLSDANKYVVIAHWDNRQLCKHCGPTQINKLLLKSK